MEEGVPCSVKIITCTFPDNVILPKEYENPEVEREPCIQQERHRAPGLCFVHCIIIFGCELGNGPQDHHKYQEEHCGGKEGKNGELGRRMEFVPGRASMSATYGEQKTTRTKVGLERQPRPRACGCALPNDGSVKMLEQAKTEPRGRPSRQPTIH